MSRSAWMPAVLVSVCTASALGAQTDWTQRATPPPDAPSPRSGHAMAHDLGRGVLVLFGGRELGQVRADTWEWDGSRWTERQPSASPSPRFWHGMAYDTARGVTVLFGGSADQMVPGGETWEYDGTNWVQRTPATSPPAQPMQGGMAFDQARGRVVLFGENGDTWEYDGTNWVRRTTASSPPPNVSDSFRYMAYDVARQRIVLVVREDPAIDTTWEYDGTDWVQVAAPPYAARIAWHPGRGRIVLFDLDSRTWEWNGTAWSLRTLVHRPPPRLAHTLSSAPGNRVLLFGGTPTIHDETWVLDGQDWHRPLPTAPRGLRSHAMAYDTRRGRTVVFGGHTGLMGPLGPEPVADTWEWDGTRWHAHVPTGAEPPARHAAALAYDPVRAQTVMFGGANRWTDPYTWLWDGNHWVALLSRPPARWHHTMAFDTRRGVLVLFGGRLLPPVGNNQPGDDTWEWGSRGWTQSTPARRPTARWSHAMAFDEARGVMVMYGGWSDQGALGDTWEWDGNDWRQRTPVSSPPLLAEHAMAYDADRERTVLFERDRTWEWDGSTWRRQVTSTAPPSRLLHAMVYDALRREVLLFGGLSRSSTEVFGDTWTYAPAVRGDAATFGTGCPGERGVPRLAAAGAPILGNRDFALRVDDAASSTALLVAIDFSTRPTPLPGGCTAYTLPTPIELHGRSASDGTATIPLPLPADPVLRGGTVFGQAIVLDPQGTFFGLLSFSPGLRIVLGD